MIYGANGYTGRRIASEAARRGQKPLLAGRRTERIEPLAAELDLPWRVFPLDCPDRVAAQIEGLRAVLHCAGPFSATAEPMMEACLRAGVDYLDITGEIAVIEAAAARHVYVANTPDVLTDATADLAWTLILGAARRTGEAERFLRAGRWAGWGPRQFLGMSIHGATLGLFGMGRIGRAVAARAQGFDMRVIYHDKQPLDPETAHSLGATFVDKDTLLAQSDVLSIHCPLTAETRHAFGLKEFQQMKRTAVLVNTARGPVVNEAELCRALEEGLIFAAGIDVYEFEPMIHEALLRQERALLLPHLGSATVAARAAMARMAAENIVAALKGRQPPNCVYPHSAS